MDVYVAGSYASDRNECRAIADMLASYGHKITHNWFDSEDWKFSKAISAKLDIHGVLRADSLVVLMDMDRKFQGTWCEVGMALASKMPVYFIGDCNRESNVFMAHEYVRDFVNDWPEKSEIQPVLLAVYTSRVLELIATHRELTNGM